jgi:oligopeptide/dipeptide ABC transporter ATP-binding protein
VSTVAGDNILELKDVKTHFPIVKGAFFTKVTGHVKAVDGINLTLKRGEVLGLVGESGCGKSTLGRTIMRLVNITSGSVTINGKDIAKYSDRELVKVRPQFQMIFQDPYASLNPRLTVFDTLAEPLQAHGLASSKNIAQRVSELMEMVGLAPRFMRKYPHEFSGGQRQRIAIARALALNPSLLIADEPVSALDVSIQAQILNLLAALKKKLNISMIFISHDLSVIRYISDRVAVMYLGRIVETGPTADIFANPQHPYTRALLSAIPLPDPDQERTRSRVLLEGDPPSPINQPSGCHFHPRCPYAKPRCAQIKPELELKQGRQVACIRVGEI